LLDILKRKAKAHFLHKNQPNNYPTNSDLRACRSTSTHHAPATTAPTLEAITPTAKIKQKNNHKPSNYLTNQTKPITHRPRQTNIKTNQQKSTFRHPDLPLPNQTSTTTKS